ncbi:hypothetical protein CGRAC_1629 [Campylobacter gracilis]|uniref:Uncharacterized protein n=1 Tax=Campylobacter gracilis RM3268 TaxID=553220 RepID=C8PKA6_9BACT|nr:hypothetical protein CGRAC_1629 [Campylobacter gracilis]EEV16800.1 hypothetical protein CAMGR0001_1816 [Campylobacter gracilis RM3268]
MILQAADFTFARIALRFVRAAIYQPAAQRDFMRQPTADNRLSAALARCHPIWEYIKRFEILFIKS